MKLNASINDNMVPVCKPLICKSIVNCADNAYSWLLYTYKRCSGRFIFLLWGFYFYFYQTERTGNVKKFSSVWFENFSSYHSAIPLPLESIKEDHNRILLAIYMQITHHSYLHYPCLFLKVSSTLHFVTQWGHVIYNFPFSQVTQR